MDQKAFRPKLPAERISQIDILRGVALFGILLVNVFGYHASFYDFGGFYRQLNDPLQKSFYQWVIGLGADKFIFMFSMLFGFGFWLLYEKFYDHESYFKGFYSRRMLSLMLIGILHILFLWAGDILLLYGILGFVLLFLRKMQTSILVILMFVFYYFTAIVLEAKIYITQLPDPLSSVSSIPLSDVITVYANGGYWDILIFRINEFITFRNINLLYYAPKILALFIGGYLAGRHAFIVRLRARKSSFVLLMLAFLAFGLFIILQLDHLGPKVVNPESAWFGSFYIFFLETGNALMGLGYILTVLIIAGDRRGEFVLNPLKYAGRMSLTNYLVQSVVFTTVFYGYGLGRFGTTAPTTFVAWGIILFILQVILSRIWLKNFRYGPLEALWRKMSYFNWHNAYK